MFPRPDCNFCADKGCCKSQANFCRDHLFAWARDVEMTCEFFRESRHHGRARPSNQKPHGKGSEQIIIGTPWDFTRTGRQTPNYESIYIFFVAWNAGKTYYF